MNTKNQLPNVKLQKTSVIFMQLGLILALFIVYVILEQKSTYKPATIIEVAMNDDDEPRITEFEIEKKPTHKKVTQKKVTKAIQKQQVTATDQFKTIENDSKKTETIEKLLKSDETTNNPKKITLKDIGQVVDDEPVEEDIPFMLIEQAPEFPGCKGSTFEKKQCFNDKVNKFVQRKFNIELAQELGLTAGKKKISVQFIIDTEGNIVDIKARAPHKRLEKEAIRVIKLLPKMKPAKQRNHFAKVRFNLPIKFIVED